MRLILNEKNTYLDSHKKETFKLFQNIFPDAAMCEKDNNQLKEACAQETREKIDTEIDTLVSYNKTVYNCLTNENSKLECINTGRLPMYFIKLNKDENIEKLYQSGDYTIEIVDNKYEKKVVAFLKGEQYPFPFPLYTCCGGDDWLQLIPFLPKRVYLNDFPSEMEYILPVKNESGEILGAVVWLYGD